MLQATRTVPIVFAHVIDPVGAGFVDSLARPGGNATGFISFEYGLAGKWLELLKEIAPRVTRAAVLRDAGVASGIGQFGAIQSVAPSFGVELSPVNVGDAAEIERAVAAFARSPNGGLIVTAGPSANRHRDLIVTLAARHKLPAVYSERSFVAAGGLISYGTDYIDQYRQAAGYVDRILKGEKPADLPVQTPTKYELVINLKTAKALGLDRAAIRARARRRGDRMRRREFIAGLGGAAASAVSWPRRARAAASACGASACSCNLRRRRSEAQARIGGVPARPGSSRAGPSAAMFGSTCAGPEAIPPHSQGTRTELVALAPDVILAAGGLDHGGVLQATPHRADRVSRMPSIRSAPASSTAWRGRAATPPASCSSNTAWREMAGAAQGDRAERDTRGGPSGSRR